MSPPLEAKEQFISNYCDQLEKTLKDIHDSITTKMNVAQKKKGYDEHNDVYQSTSFEQGNRVWLNNQAVPKGLSRKFHLPWEGPYVVLSRLGNVNYYIKPESGNGKAKVVHLNRLKLVKCKPIVKEWPLIDQEQTLRASVLPDEPAVRYRETSAEMQPSAPERPTLLRRSTRCRPQHDRYQDYNLDELEIEDALN